MPDQYDPIKDDDLDYRYYKEREDDYGRGHSFSSKGLITVIGFLVALIATAFSPGLGLFIAIIVLIYL